MEHAKKMVLVDPRMLQHKPSPLPDAMGDSLREMDQQMQSVLDRNDLNAVDKANLYQQTLRRYMQRVGDYKDRRLPDKINPGDQALPSDEQPADQTTIIEQDVLQSVPKTMRGRAERLLHRLKSHPDVTWNSRGEIEYQGLTVKESNITDLVNDVLRKRRNAAEPVGWKTFATALQRMNVPQDLIGNPDRWKYMRGRTPDTLKRRREQTPLEATPGPETPRTWKAKKKQRKLRQRLALEDWERL